MAGLRQARIGLCRMHGRIRSWQGAGRPALNWQELAPRYRVYLYGKGERRLADAHSGLDAKPGIASKKVVEVIEKNGGQLPLHEILRCRVRYFCDGAVLGSAAFVEQVIAERRESHGIERNTGAAKMRGARWDGLVTLRNLRDRVFGA
jgi:hypothetical protein